MFTPEEAQALNQLRRECTVRKECMIKQMDGGFLLATTEMFVNGDHTIVAKAQHTKICSRVEDVPTEIFNIFVGVPTTQEHVEAKVEYLTPVEKHEPDVIG